MALVWIAQSPRFLFKEKDNLEKLTTVTFYFIFSLIVSPSPFFSPSLFLFFFLPFFYILKPKRRFVNKMCGVVVFITTGVKCYFKNNELYEAQIPTLQMNQIFEIFHISGCNHRNQMYYSDVRK